MGVIRLSPLELLHDAPALEREKIESANQLYQIESLHAQDHKFEEAYSLLDSFFGARGELEGRSDLGAMLEERDIWFAQGTLFTRYHVLTAHYQERLVGVRDCYTEIDPHRRLCLIALSHSFIVEEHRRTGLAALFRTIPISLARTLINEFFPGEEDDIPILVTAEMEPAEPPNRDTLVRYLAYGRAGFSVIDPTYLPYSQPDFRDLRSFSHIGIPLLAVLRWVGQEKAREIPADLACAFPRHYNGFHYRYTARENVDAMIQHALSTLESKQTSSVPLLPLPTRREDGVLLTPLLKSRVLPLYPPKLQGEHHETMSFERESQELSRWSSGER